MKKKRATATLSLPALCCTAAYCVIFVNTASWLISPDIKEKEKRTTAAIKYFNYTD